MKGLQRAGAWPAARAAGRCGRTGTVTGGASRGAADVSRTSASSRRRASGSRPPAAEPEKRAIPTRRVVLSLGEAGLELVGAAFFEFRFRATAAGDDRPKGLMAVGTSLLPQLTDPELVREAEEALREGRTAAQNGNHEVAVRRFSRVLEVAPHKYKLCQMALMGRSESFKALGRREEQRQDSVQNWCWGRGLRWPGHYILAYILGRRAFVMEDKRPSVSPGSERSKKGPAIVRGGRRTGRTEKQTGAGLSQRRKRSSSGVTTASTKTGGSSSQLSPELFVVIALAAGYNYFLLTYGLEY